MSARSNTPPVSIDAAIAIAFGLAATITSLIAVYIMWTQQRGPASRISEYFNCSISPQKADAYILQWMWSLASNQHPDRIPKMKQNPWCPSGTKRCRDYLLLMHTNSIELWAISSMLCRESCNMGRGAYDTTGVLKPPFLLWQPFDNEQWQALIALHRTLLHEHHDFFLASQHPSASPALRRLASKYAMPARMRRHGIHSFLELLRHSLLASLDHMLTFIYLAYSIMALLHGDYPGVRGRVDECLGDLGRYRTAIEVDDIRGREVWTGAARHWYFRSFEGSTGDWHPVYSRFWVTNTGKLSLLCIDLLYTSITISFWQVNTLRQALQQYCNTGSIQSSNPSNVVCQDICTCSFSSIWHSR